MQVTQESLGRSIKIIREQMEWTATRLAKEMKVSQPHLSNLESGKRPLSLERAGQIERITGVNPYVHAWLRMDGFGMDSEINGLRARLANLLEGVAKSYGESGV